MATASVSIAATYAGNKPLEALNGLIAKRVEYLRGETTENAVTATTINVLKSLRAEAVVAPREADEKMIKVELVAANAAGWRGHPARRKATPNGKWDRTIRPVNLMYGLNGDGYLYRITLLNPNLTPKKSLNKPFYYVLAPNTAVATNYGLARMTRVLKKESGMSRYAIQMSAAKVYDKAGGQPPMPTGGSSRAFQIARDAVTVNKSGNGFSSGQFSISYFDAIRYSSLALKSGPAAVDMALMKAANSTAGIINKIGTVPFDQKIPTPFPEISKSKSST